MAENAFHLFTMKCDALETTLSLIDTSGIRFDTSKNVKVTGNGIIFDAYFDVFCISQIITILSGKSRIKAIETGRNLKKVEKFYNRLYMGTDYSPSFTFKPLLLAIAKICSLLKPV